jgi:molybdenum cofactor cytidylyltransferase
MSETCAIILAAGESLRMGTNKLLLPFNGSLIINKVIENIIQSQVNHILVVLGAFRNEMIAAIGKLPVAYCENPDYKHGMLTSVQCGFKNMPETTQAAVIFLGDQPMIPGHVTRLMIRSYEQTGKGILVPVYKGKRGHPILIDRKYADAIIKLDPAEGLRTLLVRFSKDVQEVEVEMPEILRDIDTVEDYRNEINLN